jgi:hypothetical protein
MYESLLLLKENWKKFSTLTRGSEKEIIEQLIELVRASNRKVKETASDCLEAFIEEMSAGQYVVQPQLVSYFVNRVKGIVGREEDPVEVMVCVRCFGHLASLVKRTLGQEELQKHFLLLFEISQNKVLDDITDSYKTEMAETLQPENFKKILYRQKQLNSHIKAFALIVKEMEMIQEPHAKHLLDLFLIGVKKHRLFFEGYKKYLYIALAQLISSLALHPDLYKFWAKKAVGEMLNIFVQPASQNNANYDQDYSTIKTSAEFIVRLLNQEVWNEETKKDFSRTLLVGLMEFFQGSEFGYEELIDQGHKLYLPINNEDHHSTLRLALIFDEVQRQGVLDTSLPDHFSDLLEFVSKGLIRYPRTTSLQKLFRSMLTIAERLWEPVLQNQVENIDSICTVLEMQFRLLRELRGDILFDNLRSLLCIPTLILKMNPKLLEVFRRALLITLEAAGPQSLFMLDLAVTSLERVLVKEKVEIREAKDKFLQEVLPYFSALLDFETGSVKESPYSLTVQEASLEKEQVQRKCISFLGSLGSDLLYIARGRAKEHELEQGEADALKISIPINKHRINISLSHVIKRSSQLALESPSEEVQAAASELFHGSMIVLIGKCSQGGQAGEDFVEALESALPSVVKIATSSSKFAPLFKVLLLQISRWLSLNKEEESALVGTFLARVLELAGKGDKPEMRSICLDAMEQFLISTCRVHLKLESQARNFGLFFRKVEALTLHPDPFKRVAGLVSLRLVAKILFMNEALLKMFFYEIVFYFLLFLRKQETAGDPLANDSHTYCEEIYSQIETVLRSKAHLLDNTDNEGARFSSINDLFTSIQKNLFSPEPSLRDYSLRLFLFIRSNLREHLLTLTLKNSLSFLDDSSATDWDDPLLSIKSLGARCSTLATLVESGTLPERELRESKAFAEVKLQTQKLAISGPEEGGKYRQEALSKVLQLAGVLGRSEDQENLIALARNPGFIKSILQAAFSSLDPEKDIEKCKKVLFILNVPVLASVREFVNTHDFRFDGGRDPIYSLERRVPTKSLEQFFNAILMFLSPEEIRRELLNSVRVYHMLRFVKTARKNSPPEAVSRARIFLGFLLRSGGLEESQVLDFLDPFGQGFDNFAPLVQSHLVKLPDNESKAMIRALFIQSRKNHNLFCSILDLLSLFLANKLSPKPFFDSFTECFDPTFIRSHDLYLKNILSLGTLFLQQGHRLSEEQSAALVQQALLPHNRQALGPLALEFLGHFARDSTREQTLLIYRRTKPSILDYSQEILPVILDDHFSNQKELEVISVFATKIFDFVKASLMLEPLEVAYPLLRNRKRFRNELTSIIESLAKENKYDSLLQNTQFCLGIFRNRELSSSLEFNIRFTIIDRVLLSLLEHSCEEYLRELFIEVYPDLEKMLSAESESESDPRKKVLALGEKSCVFKIIELFFRKISPTAIKDFIHPRLIGAQTQKNEITKKLIVFCMAPRKLKRTQIDSQILTELQGETEQTKAFASEIISSFFHSAYSCLVSVLLNTQSKDGPLNKFLLSSEPDKDDRLLENLVDLKTEYAFKVPTNFQSESLNDYYKVPDADPSSAESGKEGIRQFVARLTANSLFTQTISRGRLIPEGLDDQISQRKQLLSLLNSQEPIELRGMDVERSSEDPKLEMDRINQHPNMRPMLRLIDHLNLHFSSDGTAANPPSWVSLLQRMFQDHTALNYRIFLLKLLMNRPEIFKQYREIFAQYLLEYLGLAQTGGAGFHYYLRDVCTTLLTWYEVAEGQITFTIKAGATLLKKLCYDGVRSLCKKLADESKPIFHLNISIFQRICHTMKNVLVIDSGLIFTLLTYTEKPTATKNGETSEVANPTNPQNLSNATVLWRLAGISVLETSVLESIELGTDPSAPANSTSNNENTMSQSIPFTSQNSNFLNHMTSQHLTTSVSMDMESESGLHLIPDKIMKAVMMNMRVKKKVLSSSSFRLAGIYLKYLWDRLPYSSNIFEQVKAEIVKEVSGLFGKDITHLEVNICELCKVCPEITTEIEILSQLTSYIMKTTSKQRAYIFNCIRGVYKRCLERPNDMVRVSREMTLSIQANIEKILRDSCPENAREFVLVLIEMSKLKDPVVTKFLEDNLARICDVGLKLLSPIDSLSFFDLIVLLYEYYRSNHIILSVCKRYMAVGLSHPDESVRKLFEDFLHSEERVMSSEESLLVFILRDLYNPEFEQYWLTTSAQLVLSLSSHSSRASEYIFDRPLAGYVSSGLLTIPSRANLASQMTQPLIPLSLVAPSQDIPRLEKNLTSATQDHVSREVILKAKSKYLGPNTEVGNSDEKISNSVFDDTGMGVFSMHEPNEDPSAKLSVIALSKTLAGQALRGAVRKNQSHSKTFGKFLHQNQVSFNQVTQTDDNKVRVVDVIGAVKKPQIAKPMPRKEMISSFSTTLRTLREYRQGELPDIQIKYSDLLKPLAVISSQDPKMAQLIFVPLFVEVHQKQSPISNQANFKSLLDIIDRSHSNYQVINTVQTILYELSLHSQSLELDPSVITKTGTRSLSFGGAALLLEDMLIKVQKTMAEKKEAENAIDKPSTRAKSSGGGAELNVEREEKFVCHVDGNPEAISLIVNLIEIYKQMNEEDILRGLYRLLHDGDMNANGIFDLKMGKKTALSLKKLEELIAETSQTEHSVLISYLCQEKRENLFQLNRWDELFVEISSDSEYAKCFRDKDNSRILTDIASLKKNDRFFLLRSMLNDDRFWEAYRESTEILMSQQIQKNILEKEHPYDLSLLAVTMSEFDRARFYLEKFKDQFLAHWAGVKDFSSLETKTEVVSQLLRQHELKEFLASTRHYNLESMDGSPDLVRFHDTLNSWLKRKSSATLDNFNYLSDTYHSRCLFIDLMYNKYDSYSEETYNKDHLRVSLDYTRGLLRLGHVDTAEKVITKSFKRKDKFLGGDFSLDYEFANLMVKSKIEGMERDINFISRLMNESNIDLKFLENRFSKIDSVMDYWMDRKQQANHHLDSLKFSLLKLKTKAKEIACIRDYIGPGENTAEVEQKYLQLIQECIPIVVDKMNSLQSADQSEWLLGVEKDDQLVLQGKMLRKGCDISESLIRWYKSKAEKTGQSLREVALKEGGVDIFGTAKLLLKFTSELLKYGFFDQSRVLFALEITLELSDLLGSHFQLCFEKVPLWVFLKWIPQILSYMNLHAGNCFIWILEKLLITYPEPTISALSVAIDPSCIYTPSPNILQLRNIFDRLVGKDSTQVKFIRALECLVHPDQRLKTWLDAFEENASKPDRLTLLKKQLIADLFDPVDELIGDGIGEFNKKFAKEMEKHVTRLFGSNFKELEKMRPAEIIKASQELYVKADAFCKAKTVSLNSSSYKTKLSAFSGWLSEYDINNYRRHDLRIEVPGQYSGDREPVTELHVKVSYFMPEVLVIQSIRKPKRLTMLGTDEKTYHCLVKGSEDLRLDQRIQQMFTLMNQAFAKDPDCSKREYSIGTFNVIPIKKNLGVMEWVKNTIPLRSVIEKEMSPNEDLLINNNAYIKRIGLLRQLAKGKDIREQHQALLSASREVIVSDFLVQQRYFKSNLLKLAIKKRVQNAEEFVKIRKSFIVSYAVLSLGSYILGVGDRHLDNFLFDYINGRIIPIDFGYSFGLGVGLYIPELMPFRLTQNFQELTYPLGVEGLFRNTLIFAMKTLKENKSLLLDVCEVFIRDPLVDWTKAAKGKSVSNSSQCVEEVTEAYLKNKMTVLGMKLAGYNPVTVMHHELEHTIHKGKPYYENLLQTVRGAPHRVRSKMESDVLPLCEQMDVLIDISRDPDILGRAWSGWAPYV